MKNLYTDKEYTQKAIEANTTGQKLYIYTHMQDFEVEVPDYETITEEYEETVYETELIEEEYQEMVFDEGYNPVLDDEGNYVYETKTRMVKKPIMIDVEETILVPVYDDMGNIIEEKEKTILVKQQKSHIEIKTLEKTIQVGSHTETVTEEVAELLLAEAGYYVCYKDNYTDGTVNENLEMEKANAEAERIAKLSLTKREVFLALYQDKGITPEQIRSQITDPAALIEFDYAERYYRGNPLINMLGVALGYTKEQLDYLFEYKTFPSTTYEEASERKLEDNASNNINLDME